MTTLRQIATGATRLLARAAQVARAALPPGRRRLVASVLAVLMAAVILTPWLVQPDQVIRP